MQPTPQPRQPVPAPDDPLTRRFARITTSGGVTPEIDGLRFIAIVGVFLYHVWIVVASRNGIPDAVKAATPVDRWLGEAMDFGRYGVQLFFVISGYILALPFAKARLGQGPCPTMGAYFLRRLTRLEPPYLVNLVVSAIILAIAAALGVNPKGADPAGVFPHLVASAAYCHAFVYHNLSEVNGVAWSLEVEVQFYVLLPLCAWLLSKLPGVRSRCVALAAVVVVHGILVDRAPPDAWWLQYSLVGYVGYFAAGMLWAEFSAGRPDRRRGSWAWDVAAFVMLAALALTSTASGVDVALPFLFATVCAAGLEGRWLAALLRTRPVWLIGGMCYTIYLYHLWIVIIGCQWLRPWYVRSLPYWANVMLQIPLLAAAVVVASAALYLLIERPCMDKTWPGRLRRRLKIGAADR